MKVKIGETQYNVSWEVRNTNLSFAKKHIRCTVNEQGQHNPTYGHAYCSKKDEFRLEIGARISFTRLLNNMGFGREKRILFWANFDKIFVDGEYRIAAVC